MRSSILRSLFTLIALLLPAAAFAAGDEATATASVSLGEGLKAIGAGLAVGIAGLGTGLAMAQIGSAGVGAIAEDTKNLGYAILLVAIPESILIFGFVVAAMLLFL